ncbi:Protein of unknown function [Pyronema omphalodes CBS 100304]|uniref:Uncharacterized protein n=1 Tax=Pyronema omphalodes (strain CBS 100304) TaxID=1076935 RepID=U4LDM1_PYROM|nr:Protein of unknown function [Pyronema omphalodes CBS 100304]
MKFVVVFITSFFITATISLVIPELKDAEDPKVEFSDKVFSATSSRTSPQNCYYTTCGNIWCFKQGYTQRGGMSSCYNIRCCQDL